MFILQKSPNSWDNFKFVSPKLEISLDCHYKAFLSIAFGCDEHEGKLPNFENNFPYVPHRIVFHSRLQYFDELDRNLALLSFQMDTLHLMHQKYKLKTAYLKKSQQQIYREWEWWQSAWERRWRTWYCRGYPERPTQPGPLSWNNNTVTHIFLKKTAQKTIQIFP